MRLFLITISLFLLIWPQEGEAQVQWEHLPGPPVGEVSAVYAWGEQVLVKGASDLYQLSESTSTWVAMGVIPRFGSPSAIVIVDSTLMIARDTLMIACRPGSSDWQVRWTQPYFGAPMFVRSQSRLFMGCSSGIFVLDDSSGQWLRADKGLACTGGSQLASDGPVLYASTGIGVFSSTDTGRTWVNRTDGLRWAGWSAAPPGVDRVASTECYAIRRILVLGADLLSFNADGLVEASSDTGRHWSVRGSLGGGSSAVWLQGGGLFAMTGQGLLRSSDSARTWILLFAGTGTAACVDDSLFYLASRGGLWNSRNGGRTWNSVALDGLIEGSVESLTSLGDLLFVRTRTRFFAREELWRTTDAGQSWDPVRTFPHNEATAAGRMLFTVRPTYPSPYGAPTYSLHMSSDGGETWSFRGAALGIPAVVGSAWFSFPYPLNDQATLYRTLDSGLTWKAVTIPNVKPGGVWGDDAHLYLRGRDSGAVTGSLWESTDLGASWRFLLRAGEGPLYYGDPIHGVVRVGKTYIVLADSALMTRIVRSTDGGATWQEHETFRSPVWWAGDLTSTPLLMDSVRIFASASESSKIVLRFSPDLGEHWVNLTQPGSAISNIMTKAVSRGHIFVGSGGDGLWRRSLADLRVTVSVPEPGGSRPETFSLEQNFPNPFNPITTIQFAVPRQVHAVLTVYSMLGQQVAVLVDGEVAAGLHRVRFDGSNLASGVYFCRLRVKEASSGTEEPTVLSRKLLLVR